MQPLRGKRAIALTALLDGHTVTEAATASGVTRSTLWRWFGNDDFSSALRAGADMALTTSARRLQVATNDAATVIINTMWDSTTPGAATRLRAAVTVLDYAAKLVELVDIIERLEALESRT